MCQPGPARPHGDSHSGSPGFAAFHSAKSTGLRLRSSTSTRAPALSSSSSSVRCDSAPYSGSVSTWKYTPWPSITYAWPAATSSAISVCICVDELGRVRHRRRAAARSSRSSCSQYVVLVRARRARARWCPSRAARAMILSSTSVTLLTYVTRVAAPLQVAADRVERRPPCARGRGAARRTASGRTRTSTRGPSTRGTKSTFARVGGVVDAGASGRG